MHWKQHKSNNKNVITNEKNYKKEQIKRSIDINCTESKQASNSSRKKHEKMVYDATKMCLVSVMVQCFNK